MDWFTDRSLVEWPDWVTRGNSRPVTGRVIFTTWKHYSAGDKLQPSGLLGPVTLGPTRLVELE